MIDKSLRSNSVGGIAVPTFLYGTAWKEGRTEELTRLAIENGFRGIDTANQRRHYCEAAVGEAVRKGLAAGELRRGDLFLQTKFTFAAGQDHRLPYDPDAAIEEQVRQSFASSLEHLGTDFVDSYLLHGPMYRDGLCEDDIEAWRAMEALKHSGAAKLIGVSNFDAGQLRELLDVSEIAPAFVQNRCYAKRGWDAEIRAICRANGNLYQGFSLLNANQLELKRPEIQAIAKRLGCSPARIVFRFCLQSGMIALTGTSSAEHMREDLLACATELSAGEMEIVEKIGC